MEARLGACQRAALEAGVPVIVVFEGLDAAGKGSLINRMSQALDPRGFSVHPISAPNEIERYYPWMWRFRSILPRDGHLAIFDRSWYGRVLVERLEERISDASGRRPTRHQQFEGNSRRRRVMVSSAAHRQEGQKKRFKKSKVPALAGRSAAECASSQLTVDRGVAEMFSDQRRPRPLDGVEATIPLRRVTVSRR